MAPAGAHDVYTVPAGAHDVYTAPAGAHDVYTAPAGAHDVYTAPAAAHDVYTAPAAAHDVYTAPAAAHDVYTAPAGAHDVYTAPGSAHDVYTAPASAWTTPRKLEGRHMNRSHDDDPTDTIELYADTETPIDNALPTTTEQETIHTLSTATGEEGEGQMNTTPRVTPPSTTSLRMEKGEQSVSSVQISKWQYQSTIQ